MVASFLLSSPLFWVVAQVLVAARGVEARGELVVPRVAVGALGALRGGPAGPDEPAVPDVEVGVPGALRGGPRGPDEPAAPDVEVGVPGAFRGGPRGPDEPAAPDVAVGVPGALRGGPRGPDEPAVPGETAAAPGELPGARLVRGARLAALAHAFPEGDWPARADARPAVALPAPRRPGVARPASYMAWRAGWQRPETPVGRELLRRTGRDWWKLAEGQVGRKRIEGHIDTGQRYINGAVPSEWRRDVDAGCGAAWASDDYVVFREAVRHASPPMTGPGLIDLQFFSSLSAWCFARSLSLVMVGSLASEHVDRLSAIWKFGSPSVKGSQSHV